MSLSSSRIGGTGIEFRNCSRVQILSPFTIQLPHILEAITLPQCHIIPFGASALDKLDELLCVFFFDKEFHQ